jgi:hypothetical protein
MMISHQQVEAISTTKQEAKWKQSGCKVDAKWMQSGCKVDAKWMQSGCKSMEYARRNGFATEALMPLGGKPEGFLPLGGKSERLLPPMANQSQDMIRDVITVDW